MSQRKLTIEQELEALLADANAGVGALYRKLPQAEPDAALDAAVLAAARRTLPIAGNASSTPRRKPSRWPLAVGSAAGVVFAAGIAWQLRGEHWTSPSESASAQRSNKEVVEVRTIETPPPLDVMPPPPHVPAAPVFASKSAPPARDELAKKSEASSDETRRDKSADDSHGAVEYTLPTQAAGKKPRAVAAASPAQPQATAAAAVPPAGEDRRQPEAFPQPARAEEMDSVERKQAIAAGRTHQLREQRKVDNAARAEAGLADTSTTVAGGAANAPATDALNFNRDRAFSSKDDQHEKAKSDRLAVEQEATSAKAAGDKGPAVQGNFVGSAPTPAATRSLSAPSKSASPPPPTSAAAAATSAPSPAPAAASRPSPFAPETTTAPGAARPAAVASSIERPEPLETQTTSGARVSPQSKTASQPPTKLAEEAQRQEEAPAPPLWIERIRKLKRERHLPEAREQLKRFREIHPDYRIPRDLRDLVS